jgi:ABC-2 type transport system ATP-binding protein
MTMLRFEGIRKRFGSRWVLDGLTFSVGRGEVYGLLGPNGCGKSTAINILCNLLDTDGGAVEVGGQAVSKFTRHRIGACPQEVALYRDLFAEENLNFFARIYGLSNTDRERRVAELVQLFGLEPFARTCVANLSGGWRQRINIATALIHSPDVLILDEPTSAVDVEARHELWKLIEGLKRSGMTTLLTTHHLDEAERLCTRVGIMRDGRIAAEGSLPELLALVPAAAVALVKTQDDQGARKRAADLGWATRTYAGKLGCLLPLQASLRDVVEAFDGINVSSVSVQPVALEHAYLEVLHGAKSSDVETTGSVEFPGIRRIE